MRSRFAKVFFALAAALVFISTPVGASVSITMDGVWWQGLSDREKVVAVEGIITGIGSGYAVGHPDGWTDAVNMLKVSNSQIDQFFTKLASGKPVEYLTGPEFSKTFGVYVDEISLWYKVHPNSSMGPAALLGMCFADKPKFSIEICVTMGSKPDK